MQPPAACVDTDPDSGLSADTATSINDGIAPVPWWLSQDISVNGDNQPNVDNVLAGKVNNIDVNVHRSSDPLPANTQNVIVEVWVALPGASLTPAVGSRLIGTQLLKVSGATIDLPPNGQKWDKHPMGTMVINWTPSGAAGDPDGPDPGGQPGHRCLVARAYPETLQPDANCFHVIGDKHVAQRNIDIVPLKEGSEGRMRAKIRTANANRVASEAVTLRVVADTNPSPRLVEALARSLRTVRGFERVTRAAPSRFTLELPDFPEARVRDQTHRGWLGPILHPLGLAARRPSYEVDIEMRPGQQTQFTLVADLGAGRRGDAYLFHVTHVNARGREVGGITVAGIRL
jgi:hypothetical protein